MRHTLKYYSREFFHACWEVIKLPFWLVVQAWRKLMSFGGRRIIFVLGATVVVTIVALMSFVKATSQPGFCKSCHVMEPYFDAWETSTHSMITCTECHIPPGFKGTVHSKFMALSMVANYFTGVYKRSKPWAEIEDASCLREGCHDTRLLQSTEDFKGVRFDHKPHLEQSRRDRQLRCTSCHAQIVQGEHITVTETTCFLCHFKPDTTGTWSDLARCTHCHNPPAGPAAADSSFDHGQVLARKVDCTSCHATEVEGDGFVPRERCNSCHAKQEHIEFYDDRDFVHQKHVTEHKVECTHCHIAIRHGKEAVAKASDARTCGECHGGPDNAIENVWNGTLPGLPASPSSMARAGMTCTSCHTGEIHQPQGKHLDPTCMPCHDPGYDNLWPRWKEPLDRALADLEKTAKRINSPQREKILAALDLYRRGNPMHNPDLIRVIATSMEGAVTTSDIGKCAACHPAAGDAVVPYGGRTFDHRKHAEVKDGCTTCHEAEMDGRHGTLKISTNTCNSCHHKDAIAGTQQCNSCHSLQENIYHGKLAGLAKPLPSAMAAADIACTDCHTTENNRISSDIAAACVACHDENYADTLVTWQAGGDALLKSLQTKLSQLRKGSDAYIALQEIVSAYQRDGSNSVHNPALFPAWVEQRSALP